MHTGTEKMQRRRSKQEKREDEEEEEDRKEERSSLDISQVDGSQGFQTPRGSLCTLYNSVMCQFSLTLRKNLKIFFSLDFCMEV
jgi:hypothetical protein